MPRLPESEAGGTPRADKPLWRRRPPTGIAGAVFWLALWFGLVWLFRQVPGAGGTLLGWMQVLVGLALIALAIPLTWRLLQQRLLWSLRNKLILTYLLIGLAPVVLFVTLAAISAYIAAGQFSIHLADSRLRQQLEEIGSQNSGQASGMARSMRDFGQRGRWEGDRQAGPGSQARLDLRDRAAPIVLSLAQGAISLQLRHRAGQQPRLRPQRRPNRKQRRRRHRLRTNRWAKRRPIRCWRDCIGTPPGI